MTEKKEAITLSICQYCLADPRYTGLGPDPNKRCPVCGSAYSGPRRSREYDILVNAGLADEEKNLSLIDEIRELEKKGVLGPELVPTPNYWHWPIEKPELIPDRLKECASTYGEIRWYGRNYS